MVASNYVQFRISLRRDSSDQTKLPWSLEATSWLLEATDRLLEAIRSLEATDWLLEAT